MFLPKPVVLVLSLFGVTELSSRLAFNKGSVSKVRDAMTMLTKWTSDHSGNDEDEMEEKKEWHHSHHMKPAMWKEAKECHLQCGADQKCHEKCPTPWQHLAEKCRRLKHIMMCHRSCGRDHGCHAKCPMPQCPRMKAQLEMALQCHGACADGDSHCHRACPKPLFHMRDKCEWLQNKTACHKACGFGNHECHHRCGPHFGDHDHHFDHGHYHHHGHHHHHGYPHHDGHHHHHGYHHHHGHHHHHKEDQEFEHDWDHDETVAKEDANMEKLAWMKGQEPGEKMKDGKSAHWWGHDENFAKKAEEEDEQVKEALPRAVAGVYTMHV